jgi:NADP-dependent 3-hydroxy acid dehydrogenase YdfG
MKPSLRPLEDQVVVITGASSGIGLVTARMAAARGARLVLTARNAAALDALAAEIGAAGGTAIAVPADVGVPADVERVARTAARELGGFDTWVNPRCSRRTRAPSMRSTGSPRRSGWSSRPTARRSR